MKLSFSITLFFVAFFCCLFSSSCSEVRLATSEVFTTAQDSIYGKVFVDSIARMGIEATQLEAVMPSEHVTDITFTWLIWQVLVVGIIAMILLIIFYKQNKTSNEKPRH